jgi:hypothetical protein
MGGGAGVERQGDKLYMGWDGKCQEGARQQKWHL